MACFARAFLQQLQHAQNLLFVFSRVKQQVDGVFLTFRFDNTRKINSARQNSYCHESWRENSPFRE